MSTQIQPPAPLAGGEGTPAEHRVPATVRLGLSFLGALLAFVLVAYGALTLLEVAARASHTERFTFAAVENVDVELTTGSVELVPAPAGSRLQVAARVTEGLVSPSLDARLGSDGRLRLRSDCPALGIISCGVRWRVSVPDGATVDVRGEGDVRLDGVRARGRVTLRTSGGDVRVEDSDLPRLTASSSAGDVRVELTAVPRDVRLSSSAGDVRVRVPDVPYAVDASTSAGETRISVRRNDDSLNRIVARSSAGDVRVDPR